VKWQLIVDSGHRKGQAISLPRKSCLIGRDSSCQLRPLAPSIDEKHCALTIRGARLFVADLHTHRGTFVNGHRLRRERELHPGDHLQIGPIVFLVGVLEEDDLTKSPRREVDEDLVARLLLAMDEGEADELDEPKSPPSAGTQHHAQSPTTEGDLRDVKPPAHSTKPDTSKAATEIVTNSLRPPRSAGSPNTRNGASHTS